MAAAGHARAQEFTWDAVVTRMLELYGEVVRRPRRRGKQPKTTTNTHHA
jgi:hypothetical protein